MGDDSEVRRGPGCLLEALWLLGSLVIWEDELAEPVVKEVTMAGTGEARGPAGEASAMLETLEGAHVEGFSD